ncbi:MAG: hypothetical protein R3D34_14100 [Nitratireductor sp.]
MAAIMPMLFPYKRAGICRVLACLASQCRAIPAFGSAKVISDTIETTGVVDVSGEDRQFILPTDLKCLQVASIHPADDRYAQDERLQEHKAYAAVAFAQVPMALTSW